MVLPLSGTCTGTLTAFWNAAVLLVGTTLPSTVAGSLACEAMTEFGRTSSFTTKAASLGPVVNGSAADAHHHEVRLIVPAHHKLLLGRDAGIAGEVSDQAVAEAQDEPSRRPDVGGKAARREELRLVLFGEKRAAVRWCETPGRPRP